MQAHLRRMVSGAGALSLLALLAILGTVEPSQASAAQMSGTGYISMPAQQTATAMAFQDNMRKLWEDHIIWTRGVIISVAAGLPDLDRTIQRLMQNQADIGNAVRPYYGDAAADKLTSMLKEHIAIAGNLLTAAKAGDSAQASDAKTRWYANANEIAAFLTSANPKHWPLDVTKDLMKTHLDTTMDEAVARLKGDWPADIAAFDKVHMHILKMADALSMGIIRQFPEKFADAGSGPSSSQAKISIIDTLYQPRQIEVTPRTTITWVNAGQYPHTVMSDATNLAPGGPNSDAEFPGGVQPGESFTWVVPADAVVGTTWYYHCRFHGNQGPGSSLGPGMSGSIKVR